MTLPHVSFSVTVETGTGTAHLHIAGDLDYDTCDALVQHAVRCVSSHPDLRDLHLDFAHLRFCDSSGLSALLMVHRTTAAGNIELHLDNAPASLERVLATTGVRGLFSPPAASDRRAGSPRPPTGPGGPA
ncbi:putative anti-sigma factor antagonist [Actinacidiphila reveromycinica]|uniref:Putative anti-sigma factor antagonist n=1 Tax=Actinacidiphila reveromycinica TaxID=659352 RepID=A0A7U3UWY8_9ACTN|nr:STAS domain-containing protein [Streptomyces sp. SN-593]BBB00157.1 putative anti-sigma factor antagonist [Streptomyces sp. SN-593]